MSALLGSNTNRMDAMNATHSRVTGSTGVNENNWERFFGPLHGVQKPEPFAKARYTNYQLPEAYIGRNVFLEQRIKGFLQESDLIETTVLLPWMQTEEHHFIWNEWTFNRTLAGRVPHEGISRMVTSSKRSFRTHTVRRGLAFMMEGDFLRHADGQRHYEQNLEGITQCIIETQAYDTIHEILVANDRRRELERRVGTTKVSISEQIREEKKNFASLNRHAQTFVVMVERFKRLLSKKGIKAPYVLLIPPECAIFMSQINPYPAGAMVPYYIFGPGGQLLRKDNMRSNATLPDGTSVFEIRDYIVDEDGIPVQLLTRQILVSEYYLMTWGDRRGSRLWHGAQAMSRPPGGNYQSNWRSFKLFDLNKDDQRVVTFKDAFQHAEGFDGRYLKLLKNKRNWTVNDFDPTLDRHGNPDHKLVNNSSVRRRAVWSLFWDDDKANLVKFYGQMDNYVTKPSDHMQVGETMLSGITGLPANAEVRFQAALNLMHELDRAPYHAGFVKRFMEVNAPQNYDSTGRFVGESLSEGAQDLIDARGYLDIVEWKGLEHGGMALPNKGRGMTDMIAPPGFASLAGLMELARHVGKGTGWGAMATKAEQALEILQLLYDRVVASKFECPGVDPLNRLPWHHPRSGFATFFQNLFYVPRDAIFAPALPLETDTDGNVVGSTTGVLGGGGDKKVLGWNAVQLFQYKLFNQAQLRDWDILRTTIIDALDGTGQTLDQGQSIAYMVGGASGTVVMDRFLMYAMTLSPEFLAFKKMGTVSGPALIRVRRKVLTARAEGKSGVDLWASLVSILNASPKSARAIAIGLDAKLRGITVGKKANVAAMTDVLNIYNLMHTITTSDADLLATERTAKKKLLKEIRTLGKSDADDDIVGFTKRDGDAFKMTSGDPVDDSVQATRRQIETLNRVSSERVAPLVQRIRGLVIALQAQRDAATDADVYVIPGSFGLGGQALTDLDNQISSDDFADSDLKNELTAAERQLEALLRQFRKDGSFGDFSDTLAGIVTEIGGSAMDSGTVRGFGTADLSSARKGAPRMLFDASIALPGSRWHRLAGLMWTPGLAESVAKIKLPLWRPSDPRTGHTQPVFVTNFGNFPAEVWKRPEYARIQTILRNRSSRHTNWMGHHSDYAAWLSKGAPTDGSGANGSVKKRYQGEMFPAGGRRGAGSRNSTIGAPMSLSGEEQLLRELVSPDSSSRRRHLGDHMDVEMRTYGKPEGGWNRDTVFRGRKGGDRRRAFQADIYAENLSKEVHALVRGLAVGNFVYNYKMTSKIPNAMVRLMTRAHLMSPCYKSEHWTRSMDADVHVPINIIIFRAMIELAMDSMVLMKSGLETGANLFGHANFILGTDVQTKVIYGNFTFKSKANVWRPENIIVLDNVKARGYLGGMDMSWVTHEDDFKQPGPVRPSMVAMLLPITENSFPEEISVSGYTSFADGNDALDLKARWPQFSSAEYYNLKYSFKAQLEHQQSKEGKYFSAQNVVPPVSSQGQQIPFDPVRGDFNYNIFTECRSPLGADGCYSGAGQVWKGNKPYFQRHVTSRGI